MKAVARQPTHLEPRTRRPAVCPCGCKSPIAPLVSDDPWAEEFRRGVRPIKEVK